MRALRGHQRTLEKPRDLVIKADFVVRDRPMAHSREAQIQQAARQFADLRGDAIRGVSEITAEQFIRALAAQRHGDTLAAELRQKPDRKRARVRAWFVGIVGKLLNRAEQVGLWSEVQFLVVCSVLLDSS